ncbi:MAG: DUF3179 domain-containing protein [Actinomycetota bacterium]|nr:DUF3179 domain-containing protein [Actinomycetota bacterium]
MVDETLPDAEGTTTPVGSSALTRRRLLRALLGAGAVTAGAGGWMLLSGGEGPPPLPSEGSGSVGLERFAQAITSGGPPKDGIPPIDEPRFVAGGDADFVDGDDVVFGLVHAGEVRAYPQLILVWHEIVNDRFPDGPLTVTYCPLTGSTVGFRGTTPDRTEALTFGTSGDLVNSNLLMYDRQTDGRWPQILGRAITGPAVGAQLEEVPLLWTSWQRWRDAHPDTQVLSTDTGAIRNYGADPYGSYTPLSGYYAPDSRLYFDVLHHDDRFDAKQVVVGVKVGASRLAVPKNAVRQRRVVAAQVGSHRVVLLHDPSLDEARAFLASDEEMVAAGDGRYAAAGTTWDPTGRVVDGPGQDLARVLSYDVMWFAWAAFYPDTEVIA